MSSLPLRNVKNDSDVSLQPLVPFQYAEPHNYEYIQAYSNQYPEGNDNQYAQGSSNQPWQTMDKRSLCKWGIHWRSPTLMIVLWLVGLGASFGHHFYYQSLDNTRVTSRSQQQWAIRIGTAFAFVVQSALAGSIGVAFIQYLWVIVKRKPIALSTLDDMFKLTKDPVSLLNFDVARRALLLLVVALCSWLMSLVAVFPPGTLSVTIRQIETNISTGVPTLNFQVANGSLWTDTAGAGYAENSSPLIERLLIASATSMRELPITAPIVNSSYILQFVAPALKCQPLNDSASDSLSIDDDSFSQYQTIGDLWNSDLGFGNVYGDLSYYQGITPQTTDLLFVRTGGNPTSPTTIHRNYTCQMWNSTYTTSFNFSNGAQSASVQNISYLSAFSYETEMPFSRLPADGRPYIGWFLAMSNLLTGTVGLQQGLSSTGFIGSNLTFVQTGLLACPEILTAWSNFGAHDPPLSALTEPWMCPGGNIATAIENLSHNFTLSLLSTRLLAANTTIDVLASTAQNYWTYDSFDLAIAYIAGNAVTLLCIALGAWAFITNGYSASTTFSSLMFTTRNIDLDNLSQGRCLGTEPLQDDVAKVQMQFGVIQRSGIDTEHAAFGLASTVRRLRKGQMCS